jgi:hypothetical protein
MLTLARRAFNKQPRRHHLQAQRCHSYAIKTSSAAEMCRTQGYRRPSASIIQHTALSVPHTACSDQHTAISVQTAQNRVHTSIKALASNQISNADIQQRQVRHSPRHSSMHTLYLSVQNNSKPHALCESCSRTSSTNPINRDTQHNNDVPRICSTQSQIADRRERRISA